MICNRCGANIPDNSLFCQMCGAHLNTQQYQGARQSYYRNEASSGDKIGGFFLGLFSLPSGLLTALISVVLYIIYKPQQPAKASALGKWTWIGAAVSLGILILLCVLLFVLFVSGVSLTTHIFDAVYPNLII